MLLRVLSPPAAARAGLLAFMLALAPVPAWPADPPASIKDKVQLCASCHGPAGVSAMDNTPSIAAQPDIFLQYQLVFIRDGTRKVEVMQEIAKQLTDDDIRALAAYYSSLPPPPPIKPGDHVDSARVNALIQPRHCDSCHKQDFAGQGETARLASQREDYLIKALGDFRAGNRRGRGMGTMMEVSVTLKDEDIKLLAAYLARQP
jgi:cytochrome c553